jgi:hypothetical protein
MTFFNFTVKVSIVVSCLLLITGCDSVKYTVQEEYIEEKTWDSKKGLVESSKATWSSSWES